MNDKKKVVFIYPERKQIVTGGQLYESWMADSLSGDSRFDVEIISTPLKVGALRKVRESLRNLKYASRIAADDIVVFNSTTFLYYLPLLWLLRLRRRGKSIVVHHHFIHMQFEGIKSVLLHILENCFMKSANHALTPNPQVREIIRKELKTEPLFCMIPMGKPDIGYDAKPAFSSPVRLLYVGTIEPRKGLIYLIPALKRLKEEGIDYSFTIIGKVADEAYADELKKKIADNGLNVVFAGFVTQEELDNYYRTSDIFLFPSLLEGFGLSLNEAMAYGMPVICFDNSAMPYSVKDGENGLLVPDRDSGKYAEALMRLVSDKELYVNLSRGAIKYVATLPDRKDFPRVVVDTFSRL